MKVEIVLKLGDYAGFSTTPIGVPLSEREAALLTSLFFIALSRDSWESMSDNDWDNLNSELSAIMEKLE